MIKMSEIKKFPLCVYTDKDSNDVAKLFGYDSYYKIVKDAEELKKAKSQGFREALKANKKGG